MSEGTPSSLPAPLASALSTARTRLGALGRPARVLLASTLVVAVALAAWLAWSSANVPYSPLYTQLEREDAAAVVAKLRELHIPYRLVGDGSGIEVPTPRVHELRLELASAGLPRGGGVGFESFDRMRLGATEFEQHVLFRRALEGELARSVSTLRTVQSARVHLVLPERTVFVSRSEPASASVVVRLTPGASLREQEVSGIVHLLASSVPGLEPSRVTLVTTDGVMLHRPRPEGESAQVGSERDASAEARNLESALEERVRALLERVVGPGHADVRASVELDLARVERTEDRYDPNRTVLRSEERSTERVAAAQTNEVAGVPGAQSNVPTGGAQGSTGQPAPGGVLRETSTRNFEVDHVTERRVAMGGSIRRLTVAVVVDGVPRTVSGRTTTVARDPQDVARLESLVRGAVGYDDRRGDLVTVASVPFATVAQPGNPSRPGARPRPPQPRWRRWLPVAGAGAVALLLVVVAAVVVVGRRRAALRELEASEDPLAALPGSAAEALAALAPESFEDLRAQVLQRAQNDPASSSLVLRAWLAADVPQQPSPSLDD